MRYPVKMGIIYNVESKSRIHAISNKINCIIITVILRDNCLPLHDFYYLFKKNINNKINLC
jgi:hypothetical protein